jgi:hypothetical protein
MAQPTAQEQYWLDELNEDRAAVGAQPLAWNEALGLSAQNHDQWLIENDVFQHSDNLASDIINVAGYQLKDGNGDGWYTWNFAENHGWGSHTTDDPTAIADRQEAGYLSSPSHYAAMMNPAFDEVGLDIMRGNFGGTDAEVSTMHFGDQETPPIILGSVINDANNNDDYDIGEGLGGRTVTATNTSTGQVFTTQTWDSGGYRLDTGAGTYSVQVGSSPAQVVTLADKNVEVNFEQNTTQPPVQETFNFTKQSSAPVIATYDPGDILNFSAIDANVKQGGNQAFSWTPTSSHAGKGELWMVHTDFDQDGDLDTAFMANDHGNRQYAVVYLQDDVLLPNNFTVGVDLFL